MGTETLPYISDECFTVVLSLYVELLLANSGSGAFRTAMTHP